GRVYVLKVRVVNEGEDSVVFPDGACGIYVERKVNGEWRLFYKPISIQVLVELRQGEARTVTVRLKDAPEGDYRVVAAGWLKSSHLPVSAVAEFAVP
ncbi:MAG: hypothetical protein N3H31_04680, partial [Candidatus Nezhaarchaeota archaeon]|nr:hypothetical protein [Candidatus Nezhaarchaeota archaeon]